jgi:hypothetical protein
MNKPVPTKSLETIAMILMTRPAKTEAGRAVQTKLLARIERDIAGRNMILALIASEL